MHPDPELSSTTTRRSRRLRRPLTSLVAAGALVAACTGSDAGSEPDPTPAPTADTDEPGSDEPGSDDTGTAGTDETDAGDTGTQPDDEPGDAAPTTTGELDADPSADLPTVRPDEVAPPTTVAGPLPTPTVRLIEEASYDQPIDATSRPGDLRLFVVEKPGRVIGSDAESSVTVVDLPAIAAANDIGFVADGGEQGLLGVAFHPTDPLAYVHFSGDGGDTVLAELSIDPVAATADPASYRELLRIPQPFVNHNGGELEFGPDGLLYLALGDGGSADDPERSALDLSSPLGSILRLDPTPSAELPYTVPADNPYVGQAGVDPLIWSSGLRNPWKFSFDAVTGDLWIADVGQGDFEEINRAPADPETRLGAGRGLDFGWSAFEAYEPFNSDQASPSHTPPVAAYPHVDGACSVSGGVVARSSSFRDLNGWYVYGDFCSGQLWALDTTTVPEVGAPDQQPTIVEIGTIPALTSVVVGPDGDIYATSLTGTVYRLAPA